MAILGVGLVAAPAQAAQYLVIPWLKLRPVPQEETIEIMAFMEAADESKKQGGAAVKIRVK